MEFNELCQLDSLLCQHLKAAGIRSELLQELKSQLEANPTASVASDLANIVKYTLESQFEIIVSNLSGETYSFSVHPWTTLSEVKILIEGETGVPSATQRLMRVSSDGVLEGDQLSLAHCHIHPCNAQIAFVKHQRLALTAGSSLKLWNLLTGDVMKTTTLDQDQVAETMSVDWPSMRAISGGEDMKLWNLDSFECVQTVLLDPPTARPISVAVHWPSLDVLSLSCDGSLRLYDFDRRLCQASLQLGAPLPCPHGSVAVDWPSSMALVGVTSFLALVRLDLKSADLSLTHSFEDVGPLLSVTVDWLTMQAISGGVTPQVVGTLQVWNLHTRSCSKTFEQRQSRFGYIFVDWSTMRGLCDSTGASVVLLDITNESLLWEYHFWSVGVPCSNIAGLVVDWEAKQFLASTEAGDLMLWDINTGVCSYLDDETPDGDITAMSFADA